MAEDSGVYACAKTRSLLLSLLSMEEHVPADGPVSPCQVCGISLTSPKKYQIHKVDGGFSLGGKVFVLQDLPSTSEGHACHKCYQANLKARVRICQLLYLLGMRFMLPEARC